jgi:hypothetical protein
MRKRFLLAVLPGAAAVVALTASPAAAASVEWNGVNGLDSVEECDPGQTPFLHWILTKGGPGALGEGTLDIDGEEYEGFYPGGANGALHFLTFNVDPDDITSAEVTFDRAQARNSLLTISDGCTGESSSSS